MRRFIGGAAALLIALLATQVVVAQYTPSGSVTVSTATPAAGGEVIATGQGFAAASEVRVTLESTPVLLATVTTDQAGSFTARVTIPSGYSGTHQLVATGVDPSGSVRVLVTMLDIKGVPATDTLAETADTPRGSDAAVLGVAGLGIVGLTLITLYLLRRRLSSD